MSDILDKAILIGMGLEKKAKEVLEELQKAGKEKASTGATTAPTSGATAEGLSSKQVIENKVVEEGIRVVKEFLAIIEAGKEKIEKEVLSSSEKVAGKLNVATKDDLEVIKEMARIAREKVDRLEKRVEELEAKLGK